MSFGRMGARYGRMGASGAVAVERPTAPVLSLVEPVTDPPSFTAVIDDTVGSGDSYQLQVQADGGDWSTLLVDDTDTITSGEDAANQIDATVSALGAGNYDARMRVRDGSGPWSNWSNVVDVTIVSASPPALTFVGGSILADAGSNLWTASGVAVGSAYSSRRIIAIIGASSAPSGRTVSGITIGGVSGTVHKGTNDDGGATGGEPFAGSAIVPTGTTADVAVQFSSSIFAAPYVALYAVDDDLLDNASPTHEITTGASGTSVSDTITVEEDGILIVAVVWSSASSKGTITCTGDETFASDYTSPTNIVFSVFSADEVAAGASDYTVSWTGSFTSNLMALTWR